MKTKLNVDQISEIKIFPKEELKHIKYKKERKFLSWKYSVGYFCCGINMNSILDEHDKYDVINHVVYLNFHVEIIMSSKNSYILYFKTENDMNKFLSYIPKEKYISLN